MLDLIKTYYRYNTWATERLLDAVSRLTPEQLAAPGCSGHGSTMETLSHLLNSEYGWFYWYDTDNDSGDDVAITSVAEARNKWVAINAQTQKFIDRQTEETLNKPRFFTLSDGTPTSLPLWEMLLHTANHATHTRAQIVAAVRRNGTNPGQYDLIHFSLTAKK